MASPGEGCKGVGFDEEETAPYPAVSGAPSAILLYAE